MSRHDKAPNARADWLPARGGMLQRSCSCGARTVAGGECEACSRKRLQGSAGSNSDTATVPPIVNEALSSPGQPLDSETRTFMETRFPHDFSGVPLQAQTPATSTLEVNRPDDTYEQQAKQTANDVMARSEPAAESTPVLTDVRIHADSRAAESAQALNARAYTIGSHIVFDRGEYEPSTSKGRQLLAHELTHVAQQTGGAGTGLIMRDKPDAGVTPQKNPPAAAPAASGETLFFQDPKIAGDPSQPDRKRVYVETNLSTVGSASVRFAYPMSELTGAGGGVSKASKKVEDAKAQILKLMAEVVKDLGNFTFSSPDEETRISQERARLGEAFKGLTSSKPLNIFIATQDSPAELMTGKYIPVTDTVYIDAKDVGDKTKLEAAIRLPLQNLAGGISAKSGAQMPAQTQDELKKAVLHEGLHAMLISKGIGSDAQWNKLKPTFKISGPPDAQDKGEELVRKFLIAQEEVFVYESVALLYPPVDQVKAAYDVFMNTAEKLLKNKGATMKKVSQNISVSEKVANKAVTWTITYNQPDALTLTSADTKTIDVVLLAYPNR